MRICSNIVALEQSYGDYMVQQWFQSPNRSMTSFFNQFIELLATNNLSVDEIYWFIGNLMKCPIKESTLEFLQCDNFPMELNMNAILNDANKSM